MRRFFLDHRWTVGLLSVGLLALLGTGAFLHLHGSHELGHRDHASTAHLKLNAGKKWETDASLRLGMDRIRVLAAGMKTISSAVERQAFADGIRVQVDFLVKNCKLEHDADETLHVLIADMLEGADIVSKAGDADRGVAAVREALETYPNYFEHPNWGVPESGASNDRGSTPAPRS